MILKASNIYKTYGELPILKGVNLEVEKGEIVSIVGASGAGKSTLLHIIGTLDKADKGELYINGSAIHELSANALSAFRNEHIGFVFQFHHLLPEFTALENVCIPAYIGGKNHAQTEKKAMELLDLLGVAERAKHKPSQLSGGEQQRVSVARALINNPSIILADEPSGNLDSENASSLHKLFFHLRDTMRQTFIIVTHNEELAGISDRTIHMRDGFIY
ncbi:ABC transporter ATP-binding protein [Sphingobacterium alkalisoli]|uniref:ABC transporter ATP-binding protein n=1 Tax=Sphingobacterium alkalisoli TaxID=1874115 RepID=A0A4U0H9U4_9SPHI|nr:ABC transporter ATP-binding protein [Sphingobacterium alkalisoli]TJY68568.1 ABC transporter ATP-binding protein [Sphingobacterium alkalisoli]GGH05641.1 lipoprotein-releasing system ATP-binding protein LolD [Sphingobacterium alkalisoli]